MRTVPVATIDLEMTAPPADGAPPAPAGATVVRVCNPTAAYYRYLYDAVGADWHWVDRHLLDDQALLAIIGSSDVALHVLHVDGAPAGFVELDGSVAGEIEIAYFGLMPQFLGKGLGRWFLRWAVEAAWAGAPKRVWLHTCELDHPAALPTYEGAGFVRIGQRVVQQPMPGLVPHVAHSGAGGWSVMAHGERYEVRRKQLSQAAGGVAIGCSLLALAPGKRAYPLHFHLANEEGIFVLQGRGVCRIGDSEVEIGEGDYVAFPIGAENAHQLTATTAMRYLCVSTQVEPDVVGYPKTGKVGIFAGTAPGGDRKKRTMQAFLPESAKVGYWDGEDD